MTGKQQLAAQLASTAVLQWREDERMAWNGVTLSKGNAIRSLQLAVNAGVPQAELARLTGFSRQRLHQLLNG